MARKPSIIPFHEFCAKVLHLKLSPGQLVIAKVAFGGMDPDDLYDPEECELARVMFGGVTRVSESAKRFVCLLLGRGSGKTTMCAAYSVYVAVCQDVTVGPGDTPYVITVAPDRPTAALAISMCREMIRSNPALERLVVGDEKTSITLRRPGAGGIQVKIEAFAASRGGSSVRGRTILGFLLDEACFFTSNGDGGGSYSVSDTDIFRALKPRLVNNGKGMLVSTPWPVETLMGSMFERNWGKCEDAVAIKAPTLLVRGDNPDVVANVNDERTRDPENCRREYDCEIDGITGEGFFDPTLLSTAVSPTDGTYSKEDGAMVTSSYLGPYNRLWPTVAASDLGFKNDSSTLVVCQYDGTKYHTVAVVEMRPKPGAPLKPSVVFAKFASVAKQYGCTYILGDGHYRESFKEHLSDNGIALVDAPDGMTGKQDTFSRVRAVLQEGKIQLPKTELTTRLIAQAKMVTAKPAPGGSLSIKIPRKVGLGHGDLVSAWVLAVHRLAYGKVKSDKIDMVVGSAEYNQECARRINAYYASLEGKALKNAEREVRNKYRGKRRPDGCFFERSRR